MNEKRVRSDRSCPYFEIRALVALFLCAVLFTGCASVRPGVVAGEFGPSWQAREAAYVQEEEEDDDDFGDRMKTANRKSKAKRGFWNVLGVLIGLGGLAWLLSENEDEDAQLTFEDPLRVDVAPQISGSSQVPGWN